LENTILGDQILNDDEYIEGIYVNKSLTCPETFNMRVPSGLMAVEIIFDEDCLEWKTPDKSNPIESLLRKHPLQYQRQPRLRVSLDNSRLSTV